MSHIAHFALAIVVVTILALLVCRDRKSIRIRYVIQLLVIEVLLAYFFLHSEAGLGFVKDSPRCLTNCSGLRDKGLISCSAAWATKAWRSSS